jgi:hypothetical protein
MAAEQLQNYKLAETLQPTLTNETESLRDEYEQRLAHVTARES